MLEKVSYLLHGPFDCMLLLHVYGPARASNPIIIKNSVTHPNGTDPHKGKKKAMNIIEWHMYVHPKFSC